MKKQSFRRSHSDVFLFSVSLFGGFGGFLEKFSSGTLDRLTPVYGIFLVMHLQ